MTNQEQLREPENRDEAKAIIRKIARTRGHLDEAFLATLELEQRATVEEALRSIARLAAVSLTTLAQNLYSSDARFVFELLQNADDNKFTRADARKEAPWVSFDSRDDRVIIECNEDGFTQKDIISITSLGESSKSGQHGYIGAKGIGFKSVFIAAWKVHIQSGHYSFRFEHVPGSQGLGMITPIWTEPEDDLAESVTRITLYLHREKDDEAFRHLRDTIDKQLSELEQTCLLFLRSLKRIQIKFCGPNDAGITTRVLRVSKVGHHDITLETSLRSSLGFSPPKEQRYHVTEYLARNVTGSANRKTPSAATQVVLAFPLSDQNRPLINTGANQDLFAFLPIRQSDFEVTLRLLSETDLNFDVKAQFIVHADFDTIANRQDIYENSRRNHDLRDAIALAFLQAAHEFCEDETLQYTWPLFLPSRERCSKFWSPMLQRIEDLLNRETLIRTRRTNELRSIKGVMILDTQFRDDAGEPLLEELNTDHFISSSYESGSVARLKSYGLQTMGFKHFMAWLQKDLDLPREKSRMKSTTMESWHSKVAGLLRRMYTELRYTDLETLNLLPLTDGRWVAKNKQSAVYLETTRGIRIPPHLGLATLESTAVLNNERLSFFSAILGRTSLEAPIIGLRGFILRRYAAIADVPFADSIKDLHYLYLVHHLSEPAEKPLADIKIYDSSTPERYVDPSIEDVYYPGNHPFGPEMLLDCPPNCPRFPISIINSAYLENITALEDEAASLRSRSGQSMRLLRWREWLRDYVGVRDRLSLLSPKKDGLSTVWTYVASNRQAELLGLLETLWKHERGAIQAKKPLKDALLDTNVPVLGDRLQKLSTVYLPVPHLCDLCSTYLEPEEVFPFLQIPDTQRGQRLHLKWSFLHDDLGVKNSDDRQFYQHLLLLISAHNCKPANMSRAQRVFDLYIALFARCIRDPNPDPQLLNHFRTAKCILVLDAEGQPQSWARLEECVWNGPQKLTSRYPLRQGYHTFLRSDHFDHVSSFFQRTLSISDASCLDVLNGLIRLKRAGMPLHSSDMFGMYDYLNRLVVSCDAAERRKRKDLVSLNMEKFALIYVDSSKWHKPSECLWSSSTELQNKVNVRNYYEDLEDFFVEVVDVPVLTIQMAVDELCATTSDSAIDQVKDAIWSLNSLAQTESASIDYSVLHDKPIFVVVEPDGRRSLRPIRTHFHIADREHLAAKFSGKLRLLDYSVDQVRKLDTFFTCVGLRNRFLSSAVREFTTVTGNNGREILSPDRALKFKAHAILRHAATFRSPRCSNDMNALYATLQSARIIATDGIASELRISQDGREVVAEATSGDVHIEEEGSNLTIYVPRNRGKQALCFADALPAALDDWLMRDPTTVNRDPVNLESISALASIIAVYPSVVDAVLDRRGIMSVDIANSDPSPPEDPEDPDSSEAQSADSGNGPLSTALESSLSSDALVSRTPVSTVSAENEQTSDSTISSTFLSAGARNATPSPSLHARHGPYHAMQAPISTISQDQLTAETRLYRAILERVVTSARAAPFPSKGAFSMTALLDALSGLDDSAARSYDGIEEHERFRSSTQLERDFKIGAAGELYVFEALKRLDLPNWSDGNWQSTIRGRVNHHPDYADIEDWPGKETADIVYSDFNRQFTSVLIDGGYLDAQRWSQATPEYFIEVKTTTSTRETPFYMSKAQYRRMKDIHDSAQTSKVYLVCRVFGLSSSRIGMAVYVDPEQMRLDGSLEFTGETWSVRPAENTSTGFGGSRSAAQNHSSNGLSTTSGSGGGNSMFVFGANNNTPGSRFGGS